jgi:hypothetical protein
MLPDRTSSRLHQALDSWVSKEYWEVEKMATFYTDLVK